MTYRILLFALLVASLSAAAQNAGERIPDLPQLNRMTARFAPTPLRVDTARLSAGDKQALVKLIEAARILNTIYMNQLWSGDLALYKRLQADKTPRGQARLPVVRSRGIPCLHPRRARAQAVGREFLSPGYNEGRFRNLGGDASARAAGAGQGFLHSHPAAGRQTDDRSV
jgi:hypothetical protein